MSHVTSSRRRTTGALTLALSLASLALSACRGGDAAADDSAPQQTAGQQTLPAQWPLTGLPVDGGVPDHGVFIVKIDNTDASAPQIGLADADLVTEELVEGGLTRLAVFFDSEIPGVVGPVRSMRASDIGVVKPARAILVASGGAPPTVQRLAGAHIKTETEGAPGYYRDSGRIAPYNLMMKLPDLVKSMGKTPKPARPYLPFGSENDFAGGKPAKSFQAVFSAGHTTSWHYEAGKGYVRPDSFAEAGDDYIPDSVLVLRVQITDAGYRDPAGNPVPETVLHGKGAAMLFHDGQVVKGTWSKKSEKASLHLQTKRGRLTVPTGHVWIELVPADQGDVTIGK
jgi:Protein of unknown function (DUF3048) N-terminal domain/Protein of unknown function (DUF3048) C-terminal domain